MLMCVCVCESCHCNGLLECWSYNCAALMLTLCAVAACEVVIIIIISTRVSRALAFVGTARVAAEERSSVSVRNRECNVLLPVRAVRAADYSSSSSITSLRDNTLHIIHASINALCLF